VLFLLGGLWYFSSNLFGLLGVVSNITNNLECVMSDELSEMEMKIRELQEKCSRIRLEYVNVVQDKIIDFASKSTDDLFQITKKVDNVVITGPTQTGKTRYILYTIKKLVQSSILNIIGCDNSKDQLIQLIERLNKSSMEFYIVANLDKKKIGLVNKNLSSGKNVLFIMLNNGSQIQKLTNALSSINGIRKYNIFHDEGDNVNKNDGLIGSKTADSQKKWFNHFRSIKGAGLCGITRFWISATPDNNFFIQDIEVKDTIVLPTPVGYRPVNEHKTWDESFVDVRLELDRIRSVRNGEVILYCSDRFKINQVFTSIEISQNMECITMCYNGDGIVVFDCGKRLGVETVSIADCLFKIKKIALEKGLIIVGHRLMDRGISFVGLGETPLTATVMFYKGSRTSHCVGIAQRFGRITGNSRPDLDRRVIYCTQGVFDDYSGYISNQKLMFSNLKKDGKMKDLLKCDGIKVIKRPLDRATLIETNKEYKDICKSSVSSDDGVWLPEKMKRLVSSWKDDGNNTQVATLFRAMIACGGVMKSSEVRGYVSNPGAYHSLSGNHENSWNSVFKKDGDSHMIRNEAMEYYSELD